MAKSRTQKVVGGAFGAVLLIIAITLLVLYDGSEGIGPLIRVVVLGGLGLDQVLSNLRGRDSLMDRIGPLP